MEMLLLLLVPVVIGSLFIGGDDDDADTAPEPQPEAVNGTDGDDALAGTVGADYIFGGAGDDSLFGDDGRDTLFGDDGDDLLRGDGGDDDLSGGNGDDSILGAFGDDTLTGGDGADLLDGGNGNDILLGDGGADTLFGGRGADQMIGGDGDDRINGDSGDDSLVGGNGDDTLFDAVGADTLYGGAGNDFLSATKGNNPRQPLDTAGDSVFGDEGQDTLHGDYGDTLNGGADTDTFLISHTLGNAPVTITDYHPDEGLHITTTGTDTGAPDFGLRNATDGTGVELVLDGEVIANLTGLSATALNSTEITLRYADSPDTVYAPVQMAEATTPTGSDANDIFRGTALGENYAGGAGNDLILGSRGDDTLDGGEGVDFVIGGLGNDVVSGGFGGDVLTGGEGNDALFGGEGNDQISGGAGDDTLSGGAGRDVLLGSTGADALFGGLGGDFLSGVAPSDDAPLIDTELREEYNSALTNAHGAALTTTDEDRFIRDFTSNAGADAPDALFGGFGTDYLMGDDGDTVSGGADADWFGVAWTTGNAPVSITDFSSDDQGLMIYLDDMPETPPEFGLRDAAGGTGSEVLVDGEVVAALADVTVASADLSLLSLVMPDGTMITAVALPAAA